MQIEIVPLSQTKYTYADLYPVMLAAFQERKNAGLNYLCLSMSLEEFSENMSSAHTLVAVDTEADRLCGFAAVKIFDKKGHVYAKAKHIAILPEYKGKGLGSRLVVLIRDYAKEHGCEYIFGTTATAAASALAVHLKNGYHLAGMHSYKGTNYYSNVFRCQFKTPSPWTDPKFCRRQYLKSSFLVRMCYRTDGSMRFVGKVLKKLGLLHV